ncbi:MAG: hypothetical protein KatS3mg076_2849 [Candidatus Binatia bacterium]|nr:MAG: hypothetical protein KatS3mg076_2849 [Candidatus Binatia bacterium]
MRPVLRLAFLLLGIGTLLESPCLATPSPSPEPESPAAPVSVVERQALRRQGWPLTFGFPLPKGWVRPGEPLSVSSDRGTLPTQSEPLVLWEDGSVRWVLLDTQTDLGPGEKKRLFVEKKQAPSPPGAIRISDRNDFLLVDTGAFELRVSRRTFSVRLQVASPGGKHKDVPLGPFVVVGDERSVPLAPDRVDVVARGPLRAELSVEGKYANGLSYALRLEAYAGKPFLRVLHTVVHTRSETTLPLRRIGVDIPLALGKYPQYYAAVEDAAPLAGPLSSSGLQLTQVDARSFAEAGIERIGRLAGWFEVEGNDAGIGLHVPFFWQEFPQSVRLSPVGLTYSLRADVGPPAEFGIGSAKTHEFFLVLGTLEPERVRPVVLRRPGRATVAHVDPAWLVRTRALPNVVDPRKRPELLENARAGFARFWRTLGNERWDEAGGASCPPKSAERPRQGFFGMFHWGDWNFPGYHDTTKGCDAWGNQEYDLTQALALLFLATGDPAVHDYLVAAARHFSDVDVIRHLPSRPSWVGMNHPKNPGHFSFELGGVDPGHTWVEGLFSYWLLTGESRARDTALGIADALVRRGASKQRGNPRQFGWPALALAAAFDLTREARYAEAAEEYARRGMELHPARKGPEHWKMGILADALAYVHSVRPKPDYLTWLTEYGKRILEKNPKDIRFYPALAYLAARTGSGDYRRAAEKALERVRFGSWGKPFTVGVRYGFRIAYLLDTPSP